MSNADDICVTAMKCLPQCKLETQTGGAGWSMVGEPNALILDGTAQLDSTGAPSSGVSLV